MAIYWISYIWFPFAAWCIFRMIRARLVRVPVTSLLFLLSLLPFYGRFIEPRLLLVQETTIDLSDGASSAVPVRAVLVADMHIGQFGHAVSVDRIARKIETIAPDVVFIAGDFTLDASDQQIEAAFRPFARLDVPVYAVLGNHDVGFPGPDYDGRLERALQAAGIRVLENRAERLDVREASMVVAGVSDLWEGRQDFGAVKDVDTSSPLLLLAHNPDTAVRLDGGVSPDLILSGHTHGGQIRIPRLVQAVIPTGYPFDHGLYDLGYTQVFVTPGTGMTAIPMRFARPPRIDVLHILTPDGH
ncbi:metallophosphoesterase [Henriciella sp.]|uniref:metallophosphoesterase n=1 Tax=Henriciella sp. TaxID=1968823 RepID=UPI0025C60F91|nr:metallophosphoesterase [Henriciella sp.]